MCLENAKRTKINKKAPITAYKIVRIAKYKDGREEIFSPYMNFKWKKGEVIKSKGMNMDDYQNFLFRREIYGGMFHCYKNLNDAMDALALNLQYTPYAQFMEDENESCSSRYPVAEVEIPRKARMYEGGFRMGLAEPVDAYASRKMKMGKITMERDEAISRFLDKNRSYEETQEFLTTQICENILTLK